METIKNNYPSNYSCNTMHPSLLWCKLLYAVKVWPEEHDGQLLKKKEYSDMLGKKASKYENALYELRIVNYIDYIPKPKNTNYGYVITELGEKVLQQLKDNFGEENLLMF